MNSPFEVPVARQHAAAHQIAIANGVGDFLFQGTRVADARRAAIADRVEAEGVEVVQQVCLLQVVGDHLGSRGKTGLDPGFRCQALRPGIPRQKARTDHDGRVRRVRAARNGGNEHGAVTDFDVLAIELRGRRATGVPAGNRLFQVAGVDRVGLLERNAILRAFRAGDAWLDRAHIQFEQVAVYRFLATVVPPHALFLGVGFDQFDVLRIAT